MGAERIEWHLNAKVRGDDARKFLEDFEPAARELSEATALSSNLKVTPFGSSLTALRPRTTWPPALSVSRSTASRYLGATTCSGNVQSRRAITTT